MQWEGTSDSNNKQDANIVTSNTLCDCDSVVLSAVSGSYTKCRSVQPIVRTHGETHLGKIKNGHLGRRDCSSLGGGGSCRTAGPPTNLNLKKTQILNTR